MSAPDQAMPLRAATSYEEMAALVDGRTREILDRRRTVRAKRRGWLVRRMLVLADVVALALAFLAAQLLFGSGSGPSDRLGPIAEYLLWLATLPGWVVVARIYGLYDRDEERTDHSTVDEFVGVFHLVTVGAWLVFAGMWVTASAVPSLAKLVTFWGLAIVLVTAARSLARSYCRRQVSYLQNTVIAGAGDVGQLIARKFLQHPEYGINLLGFVDDAPKERRMGLEHLALLGPPDQLPQIVRMLDVERVVIAFSNDSPERTVALIRALANVDVQFDIVPRLFELVGPNVSVHTVESLPLLSLPPARLSRSSRLIKRTIDVVGSLVGLVLTAPLFAFIAWRIKRGSPGPVFFRQTRVGMNRREFTALKFRTMEVGVDTTAHREYIKATMDAKTAPGTNGLYKLDLDQAVTPFGRWLRKTSLDELPQFVNVLRGDMSLVGPRPCIPYEMEQFQPHHFERFLVPAGITGLWQVTARAKATFGEALEMDVSYARGWSLGLDLRLLLRTPTQLLRDRGTV